MAAGGRRTPMQIELPPSRFADLDGPVHYVEWDGPPGRTFVLVHGLGGSLLSWLAVAPGLARHGRVLAMDLPGFGRTERFPAQQDATATAVGVEFALDRDVSQVHLGEPNRRCPSNSGAQTDPIPMSALGVSRPRRSSWVRR